MRKPDDSIGFVIDFEGPALKKLPADAKVEGVVTADANGEIVEQLYLSQRRHGGWRTVLRVRASTTAKPVEMRAFLRSGDAHGVRNMELHSAPQLR